MAQDDLPPLISSRSPSYERARRELKNPSPTGDPIVVALLNHLVEAEHDAARAHRVAAEALASANAALADRLREQASGHEARGQGLGELVGSLGGSPPREGESRDVLTHGARELERLTDEPAIVAALGSLRTELAAAYNQAAQDERVPAAQRASLAQLAPGTA